VSRIVVRLERRVKLKLRRMRRETKDKALALRCQIVLLAARGRPRGDIAESVGYSVSWVNRVVARFAELGDAGLLDRREDNGLLKLDEWYLAELHAVVDQSPQEYGYRRPTWTRELLAKIMFNLTGVKVHPATMSRALAKIGARLGRPRPTVGCPWPESRRKRHLARLRRTLSSLPAGHVRASSDRLAAKIAAGSSDTQAHEPLEAGGELVRAGAVIRDAAGKPAGVIIASDFLAGDVVRDARQITEAYEDYTQLRVMKGPLEGVYLSLFVMMTLMIPIESEIRVP